MRDLHALAARRSVTVAVAAAREGSAPHYLGHRERLKTRFREGGAGALADYELLELLLFVALPRRDTKPIAKSLIKTFGSFSEVLAAPEARLAEVTGIGPATALHLKVVLAAAQRFAREPIRKGELFDSFSAVVEYCTAAMAYEQIEQFRILFLDRKNRLIADEVQGTGTVDHTPVYPREVVKRALELSATALILVHNHPSGDPTPSRADIQMTSAIADIAKPLGIALHDHIIVGRNGHVSFKGLELL